MVLGALAAPLHAAVVPPAAGGWRSAPEYLAIFAPSLHRDSYDAFVTRLPLESVLQTTTAEPFALLAPGAWQPQPLHAVDAFGPAGNYDRSRLARLYGGRRPRVARGPVIEAGQVVESWTLISPYPDPSLRHLEAGTLLLVLRIP